MPAVKLSSPDKVLFPADGITKADLAAYYAAVAEPMLRHGAERPLSLQVYPAGIKRQGHFLKQIPDYFPDWIKRVELPKHGGTVTHMVATTADDLRMLAQHNAITPHAPTARVDRLERPDRMIIDFDPPDDAERWQDIVAAARFAADFLSDAGREPFVMTTGSRGLHVATPLRRTREYPAVLEMAKELARAAVEEFPDALTLKFKKEQRERKIYVDCLRNRMAHTAVIPYGVRAKDGAPVATPITLAELDDPDLTPTRWTLRTIPERLETVGDPWEDMRSAAK
jgi:bifunctional non-homologous end joining protein LigD